MQGEGLEELVTHLPAVGEEACGALLDGLWAEDGEANYERMRASNPYIADCIDHLVEISGPEARYARPVSSLVYKLIATQGPVPFVTDEAHAMVASEIEADPSNTLRHLLGAVQSRDPYVASFVSVLALEARETSIVALAGLIVYRLLDKQAELNRALASVPAH